MRLARRVKQVGEASTDEDSNSDEGKETATHSQSFKVKRLPPIMKLFQKNSSTNVTTYPYPLVAIKILSKYSLIKAKQVDHVFNELTL